MWAFEICGLVVDGGKTKTGGLVVVCAWGENENEGAAGGTPNGEPLPAPLPVPKAVAGGGAVDDEEKLNPDGCCCWVL